MNFEVSSNSASVARFFRTLHSSQVPFVASRALNLTAKQARDAQRTGMGQRFIIRRPWVTQGIQIPRGQLATKTRLWTEIEVEHKRRLLFKFEHGGRKVARDPDMPIAIPTEHLRPTPQAIPPLSMYPKNLRLQPRRDISGGTMAARTKTTRRGVKQWLGKRRTFVIDPRYHNADPNLWGVWQRFGPKRHQIRMIWAYRSSIRIPSLLEFEHTIIGEVRARFAANFAESFAFAMRTARP